MTIAYQREDITASPASMQILDIPGMLCAALWCAMCIGAERSL